MTLMESICKVITIIQNCETTMNKIKKEAINLIQMIRRHLMQIISIWYQRVEQIVLIVVSVAWQARTQ